MLMKQEKPAERLQGFGDLLIDIAVKLAAAPARGVKKQIAVCLDRVGAYWGFDRVALTERKNAEPVVPLFVYAPGKTKAGLTSPDGGPPEGVSNDAMLQGSVTQRLALPVDVGTGEARIELFFETRKKDVFSDALVAQLHHLKKIIGGALSRASVVVPPGEIDQFEYLLSEISATYINLPAEKLEKELAIDFRRLTQMLGADVSILYMASKREGVFVAAKALIYFIDKNRSENKHLAEWLEGNPVIGAGHFPYLFENWHRGEAVAWGSVDDMPLSANAEREAQRSRGIKSALGVPIMFDREMKGIISIATTRDYRIWPESLIPRLRLFGEVFINALMRKKSEQKLNNAFAEINRLKRQAEADYSYLRQEVDFDYKDTLHGIVGKSDALGNILSKVRQVAATNTTVLILGETGTGKGLVARAIHNMSHRRDRPLLQVNCAALAPSLIESELFGFEKGAFTGAVARRAGRFEAARGTTLFLDEIGDLPLTLQPKLLRILEEGEFERVGGNKTLQTDVRLIAATSKNLKDEIVTGGFRRDLWYRLSIFPIVVPPLRDRLDDIPLLVAYFIEKYSKWAGKEFKSIPSHFVQGLQSYSWPGNIRELKNVIERAVIVSKDNELKLEEAFSENLQSQNERLSMRKAIERTERALVLQALQESNWVIDGPNGAARQLEMSGNNFRYYVTKFGIKRPA